MPTMNLGHVVGPAGADGQDGAPGTNATITGASATVTGLSAGADPTVTVTAGGTSSERSFAFAFGIPKGDTGAAGPAARYYTSQAVSAASNAEIFRITDAAVTADTVVLSCVFANPANIAGDVGWTSYAGYVAFTGTCTAATTADVILAQKNN